MSDVMKQRVLAGTPEFDLKSSTLLSYMPAILAVGGAVALTLLRIQLGGERFISDGALMMLALACYMTAAVFHLTNLYAPSSLFQKVGLWATTGGVFFNLASWGVRWVAAHDRELEIITQQGGEMPWLWRYIPFANLYDLSLAFAFGAGITTLLIAHRPSFRFLGAISLPIASLILILARFIGGEFINLPPVLDSYWRPIHVGIASLSYGIALVCFAVAVVYLLKDGLKTEAMAIWSSIFALGVFATVSRFSIFWPDTFGSYGSSTFLPPRMPLPLRAEIPYVGWLLVLAGLLLVGVVVTFGRYILKDDERARRLGHHFLKGALVVQALAIVRCRTSPSARRASAPPGRPAWTPDSSTNSECGWRSRTGSGLNRSRSSSRPSSNARQESSWASGRTNCSSVSTPTPSNSRRSSRPSPPHSSSSSSASARNSCARPCRPKRRLTA
ncbi:MAG: cytochrome c biogenesis protein [Acidobacteria bacterium]|nr:cytochrome c biogenesis protein [Acidobacteriota bacterium]